MTWPDESAITGVLEEVEGDVEAVVPDLFFGLVADQLGERSLRCGLRARLRAE